MPSVLSLLTGLTATVIRKLVDCELHLVCNSADKVLLEKRFIDTDTLSEI